MAIVIIDGLEIVQINHQNRKRFFVAFGTFHRKKETVRQQYAITQPGQTIVTGLRLQQFLPNIEVNNSVLQRFTLNSRTPQLDHQYNRDCDQDQHKDRQQFNHGRFREHLKNLGKWAKVEHPGNIQR
jgi:hypothetical protein